MKTLWSTRLAAPIFGCVVAVAAIVHVFATTACDLPVLHAVPEDFGGKCGQWPSACRYAKNGCCFEGEACTRFGCEAADPNGGVAARRDAGADR